MVSSETQKLIFPNSTILIVEVWLPSLRSFHSSRRLLEFQPLGRKKEEWYYTAPTPKYKVITTSSHSLHLTGQTQSYSHSRLQRILESIALFHEAWCLDKNLLPHLSLIQTSFLWTPRKPGGKNLMIWSQTDLDLNPSSGQLNWTIWNSISSFVKCK